MISQWRFIAAGIAVFSLFGQSNPETPLRFDAASIKPHREDAASNANVAPKGGGPLTGGGFLYFRPGMVMSGRRGVTAGRIILDAYRLSPPQLSGGPNWLWDDAFDVEAKAEKANEAQLRTMLQTMLAERFGLVAHRRTAILPVYEIAIPRGGTRLHEWKPGDPAVMPAEHHAMNYRFGGTLEDLAKSLSGDPRIGRPVVDTTGLKGTYAFVFGWDTDEEFLSSLQSQLGLQLRKSKASLETLAIDRIEKPSAN